MRIMTWNVNVLRTVLDYHPFSGMTNKNVEGLLEHLQADILCFQEHKTRRQLLEKSMACPGPYDGFWTFPRSKLGYSGVCTYVDSRVCVPLKAEEGITGLLLGDRQSTMKPPWTAEERIGHYPDIDELDLMDEVDGTPFDPRSLDVEGRAVVCDFGMFVLFNLYCPNETNETRRPYKMNYLAVLQAHVQRLMAAGREVIVAGDMNVMRAPLDSGEGGIKTTAEQHYEHPARRIFDNWCAPKGPMIDVVRESFPDREGMFTCWNTKIDARPANYGTRIDYILCSPGLRPWIKGGDIQADMYGSDHCPVYIDLHDSIEVPGRGTVYIRDLLNPADRPPSTAPVYPSDVPREAPEPPRFATKFLDEFSAKQRTLKSFFTAKAHKEPTVSPALSEAQVSISETVLPEKEMPPSPPPSPPPSSALGIARAAFGALDPIPTVSISAQHADDTPKPPAVVPSKRSAPEPIDLTSSPESPKAKPLLKKHNTEGSLGKSKPGPSKSSTKRSGGQANLASFWSTPASKSSTSTSSKVQSEARPLPRAPSPASAQVPDTEQDALIAQALAAEDEERERARAAKKDKAAPVWSTLLAQKLPPLCTIHQKPCKDFIVKIPGPNKGKRFWLCSMPVGPGYDMGRSKRPRQDVNPEYRCDFFLWDSANSRKEQPKVTKSTEPSTQ